MFQCWKHLMPHALCLLLFFPRPKYLSIKGLMSFVSYTLFHSDLMKFLVWPGPPSQKWYSRTKKRRTKCSRVGPRYFRYDGFHTWESRVSHQGKHEGDSLYKGCWREYKRREKRTCICISYHGWKSLFNVSPDREYQKKIGNNSLRKQHTTK